MSLRRADLRLALPRPARRAAVLGDMADWRDGLTRAGVSVDHSTAPDLAVAPARLAREALATGAPAILLEGRSGVKTLRRAGYSVRRFLSLPSLEHPTVVLPVERGPAIPYALTEWRPAQTATKRLRDRLASGLVQAGVFPPARVEQVLGVREPGPPFALAASARELGISASGAWFVWTGQSDPLGRLAFYVFAPGEPRPSWVLKLGRIEGIRDSFDRDEQGLGLAAAAGTRISAHAPALLGRLEAEGLQASVETAAHGEPLSGLIVRNPVLARASIEGIADWIVELGTSTQAPSALAEERHRLACDVLPQWVDRGAVPDLVDRVPELDPVLQHNDLGSWNIIVQPGAGFVAVDWESARRHGLPLWDLLYFLVDVLPLLEGARTPEERAAAALRIVRGEAESSPMLFGWVRRAATAAGVPADAVGAVATLGWLHHGLSHVSRRKAAEGADPGGAAVLSPIDRLAPLWLEDPLLGPEWSVWRS